MPRATDEVGALPYWEWKARGLTRFDATTNALFDYAFMEAAASARHIHFNLDGVKVFDAVRDSAGWRLGNFTNMELRHIWESTELMAKTTFYKNGKAWFRGQDIINGGFIGIP